MRLQGSVPLPFAVAIFLTCPFAYAADPNRSLDELRQGYALKQAGNCRDALPHFSRSLEIQPTTKGFLNLSECEQQLGDLVAAQGHAAQGRELARRQNETPLVGLADEQLAGVEKRLPRLTIKLAPRSPVDCGVSRDGKGVDTTALGAPVGVNPGTHIVSVSAPGRAERRYDVTLEEGAHKEIEVEPGDILAPESPVEPQPASAQRATVSTPPEADEGHASGFKVMGYAAIGAGLVGVAVGIVTGLAATSKHTELEGECDSQGVCRSGAQPDIDSFHALRTASTVAYVIGAAGIGTGAALWLVAPSPRSSRGQAQLWVGPDSAGVRGRF